MSKPEDVGASTEDALRASLQLLEILKSVDDDVSRALGGVPARNSTPSRDAPLARFESGADSGQPTADSE